MVELEELARKMTALGPVRVLDVHQAAMGRSMLSIYIHSGHYYMLPAIGMTAAQLVSLLDEYKERGALHFTYNAQSSIDTPHKPVLPMDPYADLYFGDPSDGLVKITAVSRSKVAELNAILDALKPPFDPASFPYVDEIERTEYKPRTEGSMARLSLRLKGGDWKHLRDLEEGIRSHLAESNLIRDITVGRHAVKGLDPEILLTTGEETTEKGFAFLAALADYLPASAEQSTPSQRGAEGLLAVMSAAQAVDPEGRKALVREPAVRVMSPLELRRAALAALGETLKTIEGFRGLSQSLAGNLLLIQFPKGILGLGGHFDEECEGTLGMVYRTVQSNPKFEKGWAAHYRYDKRNRVLSVSVAGEGEPAPHGWWTLS